MAGTVTAEQRALLEDTGRELAELTKLVAPGVDNLGGLIDRVEAMHSTRYLLISAVLAIAGLQEQLRNAPCVVDEHQQIIDQLAGWSCRWVVAGQAPCGTRAHDAPCLPCQAKALQPTDNHAHTMSAATGCCVVCGLTAEYIEDAAPPIGDDDG